MPHVHGFRQEASGSGNGRPSGGWYVYHGNEPYEGPNNKEKQAAEQQAVEEPEEEPAEPGPCGKCGYWTTSLNHRVLCGKKLRAAENRRG